MASLVAISARISSNAAARYVIAFCAAILVIAGR